VQNDTIFGEDRIFGHVTSWPPVPTNTPESQAALQRTPASGDQVEDQDGQRDHEQKVNQTSGDVETETQKPQDQNDDENCPKHIFSLASGAAASAQIGSWMIFRANSQ
jgi:hypothetical protein